MWRRFSLGSSRHIYSVFHHCQSVRSERFYSRCRLHIDEHGETHSPRALSSANNHLFSNPECCIDNRGGGKTSRAPSAPSFHRQWSQSHNLASANIISWNSRRDLSESVLMLENIKMNIDAVRKKKMKLIFRAGKDGCVVEEAKKGALKRKKESNSRQSDRQRKFQTF